MHPASARQCLLALRGVRGLDRVLTAYPLTIYIYVIGEIDKQVHSALTHLDGIAPVPHNVSAELPTPVKIGMLLKPKGGYVRYIFTTLWALVYPNKATTIHNETITTVDAEFDFAASLSQTTTSDTIPSPPDAPSAPAAPTSRLRKHPYSSIDMDNWQLHMAPYMEPPHVSIRTSQMPEVGFPVGHEALLSCSQVQRSVNTYIHGIANGKSQANVDMSSLVPVRPEYQPEVPVDDVIPPLASYLLRNASLGVYFGQAVDNERHILRGQLGNSTLWLVATVYDTSFITTILTCYMVIPLLVIASTVLFEVTDKVQWALHKRPKSDFDALMPANHLFLGVLDDLFMILCPQTYSFVCSKASVMWAPLVALIVFRMMAFINHPELFLNRYGIYFQWIVSYGVALTIHLILLGCVSAIRLLFAFFARTVYLALRWTIWCNFVRHRVAAICIPVQKKIEFVVRRASLEAVLLAGVVIGCALTGTYYRRRGSDSVGQIMVYTSICFLALSLCFLLFFVAAVVWKPKDSSKLLFSFLALYAPMVVLMVPSASYCLTIILGDLQMVSRMSSALEIFRSELINYTLCMACIVCHLVHALR